MGSKKLLRKSSVLCRNLGDETMLYDQETRAVHILNPTAVLVWELCDGGHTLLEMESILRKEFSVDDKADVSGDIGNVIGHFLKEGIVRER